ncbi:MAG TPA: endonuclease domain-containing protein [Chitinophagales bacterium]|nr:endonuclease domain-containing protein [Chitinophagales bacterium]
MPTDPYKDNLFQGAQPHKFEFAREMRRSSTDAEEKLWKFIRDRKLSAAKFRRQHAISFFVLDFYCHEVKLCVEVDGGIHKDSENRKYDEARTIALKELGITVVRFSNEAVEKDITTVLDAIDSNLIRLRHLLLQEKDLNSIT